MDIQDETIDIIMCIDVFHAFGENETNILKEFYRVLNQNGYLLVNDHHYQEDELVSKVLNHKIFTLMKKEDDLYFFNKSFL
jgi:ubiquinone/menaquinone biosynthesis C-methylase UbiE